MSASVFSVSYSDYSFAVFGDTKELKEDLKALGGKFNPHLKHENGRRPGWIVSKKQGDQLEKLIKKGPQERISTGEEKGEEKQAQQTKEKMEEKSEEKDKKEGEKIASVFIAQYTTKSIAVLGDSRDIKAKLKDLGGRFNKYLTFNGKKQSGWIFRAEQKEAVEKFLDQKCVQQEELPQNEKKETKTKEVKTIEPKKKEEEKKSEKPPGAAPFLVDYSAKSVAVVGDSRELKTQLKALGGRYNKALTHEGVRQPGWIFRSEARDSVAKLLKNQTHKRKREDEVAPPAKKTRKTEEEGKEESTEETKEDLE